MDCVSDFLRGQGVPEDAILLMEEQKYLPTGISGDLRGLTAILLCSVKKKTRILQKLREQMKTRKESPKENTSTRNVEIGWIHSDGKIAKQVRAKQGGCTRKIQMATDAGLKDILHEGNKLFFPDGISPKGSETDFEFESIGNMYKAARLTMLRFYIATKPKDPEEDASETSEVAFVSESSGSDINPLQVGEVRGNFDEVIAGSEISDDSEITFGPIFDAEEDTEDTLVYEGFLVPLSPPNLENVITITIRHTDTLHDMITAFPDAEILRKTLNVNRILPGNTEEPGTGSGILRDYFPNKLAIPFLEQVLFSGVYSDVKAHFLQYVSSQECDVLMEAVKNFSAVDLDDLVEVLDSYGCRKRITAETLPTILDEIAHKELVQKPMFVIDCWREIIYPHISLSPEALTKLFSELQPTSKKVCQLLRFAVDLTPQQKEVKNHLKRFIRELDNIKLQKFMRFCTGSDLIVTNSIYSDSYENFPDFRSEFNAVLESNVWVMDIV
ncbi:hypothetical protein ACER0C_014761 [Sarotherodon galilaeus]